MQYSLSSALTVATGLLTPQDWPPVMGRLRDVCTVRGLWGKFWHQLYRRKLNLPFTILTRFVPIARGTLLSKYLQLYLAFIASGLLHTLGAMNATTSSHENNMLQLTFFLVQPVAITIEDFAVYLGEKWGAKKSWKTKLLGRIWTFSWFTYSLRYMAAHQYDLGAFDGHPLPSIVAATLGLVKKFSGGKGLH
ncbi:uncharacterized protein BP5553_07076 [Venustampulla echinocandica]|uniref:Wax synthase domain-containing protein n=1 Tax=Venustampulla echinocandica TaxID=2656787 RepID=A0A370TIH0_9HELO|nr:uncharacterized protein BP5553_07076 [Venustampulla echinocandica]RDL35145.1 hypothetical protein BP5553_07076 [Venustampulla echinocandica]